MSLRSLLHLLSHSRKAIRDTLWSSIPQGMGVLLSIASSIIVGRHLGPQAFGLYGLIMSFANLAGIVSEMGISATSLRYASATYAKGDVPGAYAILRWGFRLRLVTMGATAVAFTLLSFPLAIYFWNMEGLAPLLILGVAGAASGALAGYWLIIFQMTRRFDRAAVWSLACRLLSFGGLLLLLATGLVTVLNLLWLVILSALLTAPGLLALRPGGHSVSSTSSKRRFWTCPWTPAIDGTSSAQRPYQFMTDVGLSTVIVGATQSADVWMIGHYLSKHELGLYVAAIRFTIPLTVLMGSITSSLWPRVAAWMSDQDIRKSISFLLRLCLLVEPFVIAYALAAPLLAPLLFGQPYAPSVLLAQILCVRHCINLIICPLAVVGYNLNLSRTYLIVNVLQLISTLALNILLLPRFGALGAAFTAVAVDVTGTLVVVAAIYRRLPRVQAAPVERPG